MAEIFLLLLAAILVAGTGGMTLILAVTGNLRWNEDVSRHARWMTKGGLLLALIGSVVAFGPVAMLSIAPYWVAVVAVVFGGFKVFDLLFIRKPKSAPYTGAAPLPTFPVEALPPELEAQGGPFVIQTPRRRYVVYPAQQGADHGSWWSVFKGDGQSWR